MNSKQAERLKKSEQVLSSIKLLLKDRAATHASATKLEDLIKFDPPPHSNKSLKGCVKGFSINYSNRDGSVHERYTFRNRVIDLNKLKEKLNSKSYTESLDSIILEKTEFGNTEVKADMVEVARRMNKEEQGRIRTFELFEVLAESLIEPQELAKQLAEESTETDSEVELYVQRKDGE